MLKEFRGFRVAVAPHSAKTAGRKNITRVEMAKYRNRSNNSFALEDAAADTYPQIGSSGVVSLAFKFRASGPDA